jgi:diguanylate cyclase (GGDEF)-like protein
MSAALELGHTLDLHQQLRLLIEWTTQWTGAGRAFALGPGEERKTWSPIASNVARDDAALASLGSVDPHRIRSALDGGPNVFDGLGPFESEATPWPDPQPGACAVLPVSGSEAQWAAVLLLLFEDRPGEGQLDRMNRLLETVRPAVSNSLQVAAMRELVIKDDTAHCFNRRYFESCLPDELSRASRFHAALSLIFLDMDNLKEVNKRHGHAMGSRTLREVSSRVRVKIRRFDKLFRFGGDEFCIVLPETEWHGALEVAERVRDAIAGRPLLSAKVQPDGIRMTASLGIASFPLHARTQAELIECADRAMQRIKNGTKNSIGIAEIVGGEHGS